jgi:hypothetical protein
MATGAATTKQLVGLSVKLEVVTKDKLRKFVFGVTKTQADDVDKWSVDFELLDRTALTADFTRAVFLDVDIDLKKVAVTDVETTAHKGLNQAQVDFVLTTLSANADKFRNKLIKEDRMRRTIGNLFPVRNA